MQATITSTKGISTITGDLAAALRAAIMHDEDYQPAGGVTVECDDGRTFEVQDGRCPIWTDGEDGEDGEVMIAGDELVIAWEQGIRTPFADTELQPR